MTALVTWIDEGLQPYKIGRQSHHPQFSHCQYRNFGKAACALRRTGLHPADW
jgi:hypothetical protein